MNSIDHAALAQASRQYAKRFLEARHARQQDRDAVDGRWAVIWWLDPHTLSIVRMRSLRRAHALASFHRARGGYVAHFRKKLIRHARPAPSVWEEVLTSLDFAMQLPRLTKKKVP